MSEEASTGNDIVIANPAAVTLENADNEQAKDTTSAPVDQGAVTEMSTSAVRFTVSEVTENQVCRLPMLVPTLANNRIFRDLCTPYYIGIILLQGCVSGSNCIVLYTIFA